MLTLQHPLLFVLYAHSRPMNLQCNESKQPRAPSNLELVLFSSMNGVVLGLCFPRDPHLLCF